MCEQRREEGNWARASSLPLLTKEVSEGDRFPPEPLQSEAVQSPWDGSDIQHPDFASCVCVSWEKCEL